MAHESTKHVEGDSGDEGVIKHGIHIVSDFLHGRKHQHHHEHEHEHEHGNGHGHGRGSPSRTPSKRSFEHAKQTPPATPSKVAIPTSSAPPTPVPAPAPAQPAPPKVEEKPVVVEPEVQKAPEAEPTPAPPAPAPAPAPVAVPAEPVKPSGPVLEAPYHLYCWGSPDSITKATSYTVTPFKSNLLTGDCTIAVSTRTEQDGPRAVLSIESPSYRDSLLWLGTEHTNLVHAQWVGGACAAQAPLRVSWHEGWTRLALIWSATNHSITVYRDGEELFTRALDEEALRIAGSAAHVALILGRAKEGGKRVLGWDGEIAEARVWDRALGLEEIRAIDPPTPVHPGYESAWNGGRA